MTQLFQDLLRVVGAITLLGFLFLTALTLFAFACYCIVC